MACCHFLFFGNFIMEIKPLLSFYRYGIIQFLETSTSEGGQGKIKIHEFFFNHYLLFFSCQTVDLYVCQSVCWSVCLFVPNLRNYFSLTNTRIDFKPSPLTRSSELYLLFLFSVNIESFRYVTKTYSSDSVVRKIRLGPAGS